MIGTKGNLELIRGRTSAACANCHGEDFNEVLVIVVRKRAINPVASLVLCGPCRVDLAKELAKL